MGKKRKNYYANNNNKNKKQKHSSDKIIQLCPNMKGFFITYNSKYTFCLNEAKKILDQFAVRIKSQNESESTTTTTNNDNSNENDFDKLLKEELQSLRKEDTQYKIVDAGAKYTLFISLPNTNVNETVEAIFEHIKKTEKPIGRYVQRLVPVINTCKAFVEDIEKCIEKTLDLDYNKDESIKYSCIFKSSNNCVISRDSVIKIVYNYFQTRNKNNKVDHDNPDRVILVQVIKNMCFISFIKNYFEYRKYNLVEMGIKYTQKSDTTTTTNSTATITTTTTTTTTTDTATNNKETTNPPTSTSTVFDVNENKNNISTSEPTSNREIDPQEDKP